MKTNLRQIGYAALLAGLACALLPQPARATTWSRDFAVSSIRLAEMQGRPLAVFRSWDPASNTRGRSGPYLSGYFTIAYARTDHPTSQHDWDFASIEGEPNVATAMWRERYISVESDNRTVDCYLLDNPPYPQFNILSYTAISPGGNSFYTQSISELKAAPVDLSSWNIYTLDSVSAGGQVFLLSGGWLQGMTSLPKQMREGIRVASIEGEPGRAPRLGPQRNVAFLSGMQSPLNYGRCFSVAICKERMAVAFLTSEYETSAIKRLINKREYRYVLHISSAAISNGQVQTFTDFICPTYRPLEYQAPLVFGSDEKVYLAYLEARGNDTDVTLLQAPASSFALQPVWSRSVVAPGGGLILDARLNDGRPALLYGDNRGLCLALAATADPRQPGDWQAVSFSIQHASSGEMALIGGKPAVIFQAGSPDRLVYAWSDRELPRGATDWHAHVMYQGYRSSANNLIPCSDHVGITDVVLPQAASHRPDWMPIAAAILLAALVVAVTLTAGHVRRRHA